MTRWACCLGASWRKAPAHHLLRALATGADKSPSDGAGVIRSSRARCVRLPLSRTQVAPP